MAFRDNAQGPDIGALLAMAEELVVTSHELKDVATGIRRHLR